jgi:hypothetical protein
VARDPNSIRFIIIGGIIARGRVITRGRIVSPIINRRGCNPDRWRSNKNPEMTTVPS